MSEADNVMLWRLESVERELRRLQALQPEVLTEQVRVQARELEEMKDELRAVRRALWGFGLSIAGGAIVFAITAMQVWG